MVPEASRDRTHIIINNVAWTAAVVIGRYTHTTHIAAVVAGPSARAHNIFITIKYFFYRHHSPPYNTLIPLTGYGVPQVEFRWQHADGRLWNVAGESDDRKLYNNIIVPKTS